MSKYFTSRKYIFLLLMALVLSSAALVKTDDLYFQIKKQLTIFSDVYKEIATLHVQEVGPEKLMKTGLNAMLEELDPYTEFIDEGEQQQMEIISTGSYGGIGVDAGFRGDEIVIIAPLEGYPAERAGIRPGDVILSVNGVQVENASPEEVQQLTIGDVGTEVTITIRRTGLDDPVTFELIRERIEVRNIEYAGTIEEQEKLGYIKLTRFGQRAGEEVREKLLGFKENGGLNGLILDLRNNPGGLLNEAVEIVDKFIEPGVTIVETKGRMEDQNAAFVSEEPELFDELPIVVLMNQGSASASEVVAGALQDLDRAVIVGQNSFGKGLVQTVRPLSYNTSLKITISQYFTPSGRSIQSMDYSDESNKAGRQIADSLRSAFTTKNGRTVYDGLGIEPDIELETDEESRARVALLQSNQFFFFIADYLVENGDEELPDQFYDQFINYLDNQNFDYTTRADQQLEALIANNEYFQDNEESLKQLNQLKQSLKDKKEEELKDSREFIERKLQEEWMAQTGSRDERVQTRLSADEYVQQAIGLIKETERYNSILNP